MGEDQAQAGRRQPIQNSFSQWQRALPAARHPFGLLLALGSLLLAALMVSLPPLAPWSSRAPLVLAAGLLAWAASATVVSHWPARTLEPVFPPGPAPPFPEPGPPTPRPQADAVPAEFVERVDDALKRLDRVGTLAESPLLGILSYTLQATRERLVTANPDKPPGDGQVLRAALVDAIERLSAHDAEAGNRGLQYQILHMEYVERRTVVQMTIRLSISEQTLYRRRKEGVDAVARDLWRQEQRAGAESPPAANGQSPLVSEPFGPRG